MTTLRDIKTLTDNVEAAGVTTTLITNGSFLLPAGIDAFGYRIVQEALTNVLKHANATTVVIELCDSGSALTLRVHDNGRGHGSMSTAAGGQGIVGMRERVATFGGTLSAEPVATAGFEVIATLPYRSLIDGRAGTESVPNPGVTS
jgi:signal transduction histidine kinase